LAHDNREIITLLETATAIQIQQWMNNVQVSSLQFSPDGNTLAAGYLNGVITLWDARPP
jgi:WD40 repeat protein